MHADAPGIAWFNGDVEAAFASAKASNKPVLLYWGAQWCPPCKQLKSAVFNRPDFIEKSKLFVAVYLDGDLPDAQKWGDEFRVTGYPTVVVFKPDRTEITRIAGNMDLSLYAGVLDNALGDVRPVKDVIELAVKGEAPLGADDCRRLAYHAFGLEDDGVFPAAKLQTGVRECRAHSVRRSSPRNARGCTFARPSRPRASRRTRIKKGGKADKALTVLDRARQRDAANKELALANADALRGLRTEFFLAARQTLPQLAPTLRERWMAIADAATANPEFAPADQLAAQLMKITRGQGVCARTARCPPTCAAWRSRPPTKMLAVKQEPYVRAGVVNSAINIYIALDDWERARDLLALEATTSNTPHYYIGDLADVEEHLGNNAAQRRVAGRGVCRRRKGPASRFQWGYQYLDGLLRLTPDDLATIEKVGAPGHRRARRPESHSSPHACRASTSSTRNCASGTPRRAREGREAARERRAGLRESTAARRRLHSGCRRDLTRA